MPLRRMLLYLSPVLSSPFFFHLNGKNKGSLQHRSATRLPFVTDFSVVRQRSGPYALLYYQVFLLPANGRALMSRIDLGFYVSAHEQNDVRFSYSYFTIFQRHMQLFLLAPISPNQSLQFALSVLIDGDNKDKNIFI